MDWDFICAFLTIRVVVPQQVSQLPVLRPRCLSRAPLALLDQVYSLLSASSAVALCVSNQFIEFLDMQPRPYRDYFFLIFLIVALICANDREVGWHFKQWLSGSFQLGDQEFK